MKRSATTCAPRASAGATISSTAWARAAAYRRASAWGAMPECVGSRRTSRIAWPIVVPPGSHELGFAFESRGDFSGVGRLLVDGAVVGEGEIATTTPVRYSISGAGLTCGWEQGPPVGEGYAAPFRFTGRLRRVVVEVDGEGHRDPEAEFEAIMSEQ